MKSQMEKLRDLALRQAETVLLGKVGAELVPSWVLITEDGKVHVVATPWGGEGSKAAALYRVREMARELNVIRYSFMTEAWAAHVTPEQWAGGHRSARDREDRIEVVSITLVDKTEKLNLSYQMLRDDKGVVSKLEPVKMPEQGEVIEVHNVFANLLEEDA